MKKQFFFLLALCLVAFVLIIHLMGPVHLLKPFNYKVSERRRFKILFWTDCYGIPATGNRQLMHPDCQSEFHITSDRGDLGEADAIVFQLANLLGSHHLHDFPPHSMRRPDVPWILASQEASIYHPLDRLPPINLDGLFNWTWSYRRDSLIHPNFSEVLEKHEQPDLRWAFGSNFSLDLMRGKTRLGVWVVSNCWLQQSLRNELVDELEKYGVHIDRYGKCGVACAKGDLCFQGLGKSYKFYFALENALCEDYVTEKLWHGLLHGMVPVVYGMGNMAHRAPPNSYINVLDFRTVRDLAERIQFLDRNPAEYFKYLEWRQLYKINVQSSAKFNCHAYHKMREYTRRLTEQREDGLRHTYKNFSEWYNYFPNERMGGRKCQVCLNSAEISVSRLGRNRNTMYDNPSRCN